MLGRVAEHRLSMRKQVTFADSQTIRRFHRPDAFSRGMHESKIASSDVNQGLKLYRPPDARCEPQLQHVAPKQIPPATVAVPTLKHAALTPAQREYLYTVAASYSAARVRQLITQHYMNVLHRCRRAGSNPQGENLTGTFAASLGTNESNKHGSEAPSRANHKEETNTSARNPGKFVLPSISNRQTRLSSTKQGKMKSFASPSLRKTSPRRVKVRRLEEEGQDISLSDCLSSLSVGEWRDDSPSDL